MVRTKIKLDDTEVDYSKIIDYIKLIQIDETRRVREQLQQIVENAKYNLKLLSCTVTTKKTICELRNEKSSALHVISLLSKEHLIVPPGKKRRSLSCGAKDDGYITGGSVANNGHPNGSTRASRARAKVPLVDYQKRTTHSVPRSNVNGPASFKTPKYQNPPDTYGMITPKVKPNTPQVILRHAKQGEMAISLHGSPLMTQSTLVPSMEPNLNIPTADGNIISLLPERGLRISQVPEIDPMTANKLRTLKEHIDIYLTKGNIQE